MHSITLNQNWKKVRVTLDPPQKGPSRKGNEPIGSFTPLWGCTCRTWGKSPDFGPRDQNVVVSEGRSDK